MDVPLAYFITFRTFGTWLPGDIRGTVDDDHSGVGEPMAPSNDARRSRARSLARAGALVLDEAARAAVDSAVRETCARRGWQLFALNVRTNHVHVVLAATVPPERVMGDLKAWATRRLEADGHVASRKPTWSRHGSTRWLWREAEVDSTVDYVLNRQ